MSDARDAILERVRSARRTGVLPSLEDGPPAPRFPALDPSALLQRFRDELGALGVESHVEATPQAVRSRVASLVEGRRVLSWDPERLPYEVVVPGASYGRDAREVQEEAELGLTGCLAAIAETGSLVLLSGPRRSRTVSLLPPVHVALVPSGVIVGDLAAVFAGHAEALRESACCTLVTGPSRTADIELTLTLGVHGPGRVIVVVGP
jgi:L-lactate dehydrogenase complex protein LldG